MPEHKAESEELSWQTIRLPSIAVWLVIGLLSLTGCGGGEEAKEEESQAPSQDEVQAALEQAVAAGIPGIALEISGPEEASF